MLGDNCRFKGGQPDMSSSTAAGPEPADRYMPGLGHYPVDEDPPGFLAIVDRFLEKSLRKS